MKLSLQSNHRDPSGRTGLAGIERAIESSLARPRARFDRARAQLSQAVGGVLSNGLEALGGRLGGAQRPSSTLLGQMAAAAQVHGHRLREVIERDRALFEANHPALTAEPTQIEPTQIEQAQVEQAQVEQAQVEPVERAAQPKLTPFVASATAIAPSTPLQCEEPIRTRTMAKLLGLQGHRLRALSIYDYLLAKNAGDDALRAEAEALRASE
ncbi:MAG: hypothetical protein JWN04_5255 [Myxococcaceae bacterium]|nr:hypothetical protein [Myxococcaceae bacterium]